MGLQDKTIADYQISASSFIQKPYKARLYHDQGWCASTQTVSQYIRVSTRFLLSFPLDEDKLWVNPPCTEIPVEQRLDDLQMHSFPRKCARSTTYNKMSALVSFYSGILYIAEVNSVYSGLLKLVCKKDKWSVTCLCPQNFFS